MMVWQSIQYLRAAAALAVVWLHSLLELEKLGGSAPNMWFDGAFGVDLFFVISGFIIWITTDDDKSRPVVFLCRRALRIVPLYWLCTLAMVALLIAAPSLFGRPHLEFWHVAQSLLFIPHLDPFQPGKTFPLLQVGWTLNYEMFFYTCFGISLWLSAQYRLAAMAALLSALVLTGAFLRSENALIKVYTDPLLLEFMAGMLIGYACKRQRSPPLALGYGLVLSALITYVMLNYGLDIAHLDWRALCWGLPASLLVAGVVVIEKRCVIRRFAGLHLLGNASFAIYLSHPFALGALGWLWRWLDLKFALPNAGFVVIAMLICTGAGVLFHLVVEKTLTKRIRCLLSGAHWSTAAFRWGSSANRTLNQT